MRRTSLCLLVTVLVCGCVTAPIHTGTRTDAVQNVILIGWDGVQRNHMKECLGRNELPNVAKLSKEGALMAIDVTTGATDTKAGWAEILTGYAPEKTGVYNNVRYGPIPEGYSIVERVEQTFGPDRIVTVFLAGKKYNVGARGPHILTKKKPYEQKSKKNPATEADFEHHEIKETGGVNTKNKRWRAGEPHFYTRKHANVFENGLRQGDNVGKKALEYLEKYKNDKFFFFVHFAEPDHPGHKHGENSEEYTQGIISDDKWLGKIVAKLKELDLYDNTRIYVSCDHGFDEGKRSHKNAPHVFFATNDPMVGKKGDRKDIAPTILWRLGFDLDKIEPPLDGKPLIKTHGAIW